MAHTNQDLFPNTNKESGLFPNLPSANQPHSYGDDHRQPSATKGVKKNGSSSTTVLHSTKNPIQLPKAKVNVSAKSQGVNPSGGLFPGLSNQNPRGGLFPSLSYQNPSEGLFPGLSNKNQPHSYGDDHRQPSTTKGVKKNGSSSTTVLHDTGKPDWYGAAKTEKNAQQKAAGAQRRGGKKSASVTTGGTQEQGQGSDSGSQTNNNGGSNQSSQDDNNSQTARGVKKNSKDNNKNKDESRVGALHKYDPNGNNLLARFTKVYGEEGKAKLREALDAFKAAGGTVDENYQIGQYGYNVRIKVDGKWITNTDEVKDKLVEHASASAALSSLYPDPTAAQGLTRMQLVGTQGGGTERGLTRRFALAYGSGDTAKGNQVLSAAVAAYKAAHPKDIRVLGPGGEAEIGQPGAYVMVMHNGELTSNSDIVAKKLASYVPGADGTATPYKEQTAAQQAFLGGSNGNTVMNRFNLAFNATGSEELEKAIKRYEKLNPGNDIKVHGKPGEPSFWIEVKTKDGWSSDTDAVINRLNSAMPVANEGSPGGASAGNPASRPNRPGPGGASGSGPTTNEGAPGGASAGNPASRPNHARPGGATGSPNNGNGAGAQEVSISEAAQKSEALMAADLNKDGTVTTREDTVLNAADRNQDGTVGAKELEKFVATADVDNDGAIARTESKAFKTVDSNDDNNVSKKELKAFNSVAGKDGEISRKEAKEALKAQIDNKQDQREHDLAVEYLKRTNEQKGGSQVVGDQAAALVSAQTAKPKKNDDDGPGKKKKNK